MNSGIKDVDIVDGLRRGDRAAWSALCSQYSDRLWRLINRLVGGDQNTVADVFQETMMAVARNGRGLSADTRLWAWLSKIGHNQAALYWRKHYREMAHTAPESIDQAMEPPPVQNLTYVEKAVEIRTLLAQMNTDYVALLLAKYLDGMSVKQMVQALGGTEESVRSKLARARKDFRERYERWNREQSQASVPRDQLPPRGEL